MKRLTHILSLVVLLCLITLGTDQLLGNDNNGTTTVELHKEKDSGDHHYDEELCSTYCSCHCCHKYSLTDEAPIVQEGRSVRLFGEPLITPPEEPLFEDPHPPRAQHRLA